MGLGYLTRLWKMSTVDTCKEVVHITVAPFLKALYGIWTVEMKTKQ